MTTLNRSTQHRLQSLHQVASVWEGDRRLLPAGSSSEALAGSEHGECVLWVDGVQGVVRAMDVVTPGAGPEAIVRTLLQAMEYPPSPVKPARPQKIVVRDREIQFFLRGALQQLGIAIDYAPELPLIDEIFRGLQDVVNTQPPQLPLEYAESLVQKAYQIWHCAPWELLAEHQVLSLEINHWDLGTLYVTVLMEYGILFYRSLDSLKLFRERTLAEESSEQLEEAFLGQNCLFLTFDTASIPEAAIELSDLPAAEIQPGFGTVHPLEGMRSFLYEEEATGMWVALEALHRFFLQYQSLLRAETFPVISRRYEISVSQAKAVQPVTVKVETLPELAVELLEIAAADQDSLEDFFLEEPLLQDDLVPKASYISLGVIPWELVTYLRSGAEYYQPGNGTVAGDGLPIILIQTSRPKAKTLIQDLEHSGGLGAICFSPGEDPFDEDCYELGILQTKDEELHLFGEFHAEDLMHIQARKKWDQRCQQTQGWCGLIVAKGVTGASRGNPQVRDMLALFEVRSLSAIDLGLGTLQLIPQLD